MKRLAPRSRLEVPAGYHRLEWGESIHEGGHALAAFLFGIQVSHVWLPGPSQSAPSVHYFHTPDSFCPRTSAFVSAAGAGAERARGLRAARPSRTDRATFRAAVGRGMPMEPYIEAAERLFRLPTVAPLLTATAEFLYHRHGYHRNGSGTISGADLPGVILGADLLAALPEDLETFMDLADDALGAVAGEEATDRYRRRGPCETEERAS